MQRPGRDSSKDLLRELFADILGQLAPAAVMAPAIELLRTRGDARGRYLVLAYGKAARGMAAAVRKGLPEAALRGLVVTIEPDTAPLPPFEVIAGGHPLPTADSLRAGARAMELARSAAADETVLFLASGGGSAALELPAAPGVGPGELQSFYRALIGSGADIVAINAVRAQASAIKGGRLAEAARQGGRQLTLEIRDVPFRAGAVVASGPSVAVARPAAAAVLDRFGLWPAVPPALHATLREAPSSTATTAGEVATVSCNEHALAHAQALLARGGILAVVDERTDDWGHERAAAALLRRLDRLRRRWPGRAVAVVAGGELSVPLPPNPGTGGRNQQFALACARQIRGRPIAVLSCGTDGIDGNSTAAGAIVDGLTMARASAAGLDVHGALSRCAAFPLLQTLGDCVITGPSGTNVRDLRVLLHRA